MSISIEIWSHYRIAWRTTYTYIHMCMDLFLFSREATRVSYSLSSSSEEYNYFEKMHGHYFMLLSLPLNPLHDHALLQKLTAFTLHAGVMQLHASYCYHRIHLMYKSWTGELLLLLQWRSSKWNSSLTSTYSHFLVLQMQWPKLYSEL